MNRYEYTKEIPEPIRIGLTFTSTSGHVASIKGRVDKKTWLVAYLSPDGKKSELTQDVDVIRRQMDHCKKAGNMVVMTYE